MKKYRKWYHDKICIECGKKYVGGTNSQRCYCCATKRTKMLRERYVKKFSPKNFDKGCCFCARKDKLQIHHIDADKKNNTANNLMVLCRSCHHKLHGKIYNKIYNPQIRKLIKSVKKLWQKELRPKKAETKS